MSANAFHNIARIEDSLWEAADQLRANSKFRELGRYGASLDTVLSRQRVDQDDPVILVLHMTCPRVEYTDRGKSAVVVRS